MHAHLRVAAYRTRNFLLMVAMHDYDYYILTGASPLQHKDKVPAELEQIWRKYRGLVKKLAALFLSGAVSWSSAIQCTTSQADTRLQDKFFFHFNITS